VSFLRGGTALSHSFKILLPPPVFILQSLSPVAFGLKKNPFAGIISSPLAGHRLRVLMATPF
jgi:hypothetical protein